MCTFLTAHALRTRHLTCDDVTEFVRLVVTLAEEVGKPYNNQAQDGGEDADPLAGCQAPAQERHGEQTGEDDDGSTQHLEAGGTGHVESWKQKIEKTLKPSSNKTGKPIIFDLII